MHRVDHNSSITSKRFFRNTAIIAILIALCDLTATFLFIQAGVSIVPEPQQVPWEAAVVLFSDFGPYGGLDDESLRRLNFVFDLHLSGRAPLIICSGGARPSLNFWGSVLMKHFLIQRGVEEAKIIDEPRSNKTLGNLNETKNIMHKMGISRAVVVSSPIHMLRIKQIVSELKNVTSFDLLPYSMKNCYPPITWQSAYCQVHHEFVAFVAGFALSEWQQARFINWIRS
jgi:hypothetical protein